MRNTTDKKRGAIACAAVGIGFFVVMLAVLLFSLVADAYADWVAWAVLLIYGAIILAVESSWRSFSELPRPFASGCGSWKAGRKRMPENTDSPDQRRRKKDALQSALVSSAWMALSAAVLMVLSSIFVVSPLVRTILTIVSLLELGMIVPVWILYKTRLKEIEGGEEDAASQY